MDLRFKGLVAAAAGGLVTVATRLGVTAQEEETADDGTGLEDLGSTIETTVTSAVAPIAGDDDDEAETEGGEVTTTTIDESFGVAIADASGGTNNFAFAS